MRCSFFKDTFDDSSTHYVDVDAILAGIKNGRWREQVEHVRSIVEKSYRDKVKQYLPAACFSGCFENKKVYIPKIGKHLYKSRYDDHIIEYTGIVVIDIDIKDQKILSRVREMMQEDPYVYSFFKSPSGGLKVLYIVDSPPGFHKEYAYDQIKQWVEDNYDIEVDRSGKNLSRLCYVSYDPDLYINSYASVFNIDLSEKKVERVEADYSNLDVETDTREVYNIVKGWMDQKGEFYRKGNRNEYLHKVSCILNRAGLSESQIINIILSNHSIDKRMLEELKTTVKGVMNRNKFEHGAKPIYSKRRKTKGFFD